MRIKCQILLGINFPAVTIFEAFKVYDGLIFESLGSRVRIDEGRFFGQLEVRRLK
jgi:hypothetical protein